MCVVDWVRRSFAEHLEEPRRRRWLSQLVSLLFRYETYQTDTETRPLFWVRIYHPLAHAQRRVGRGPTRALRTLCNIHRRSLNRLVSLRILWTNKP
jgi:hypothetical protein